MKSTAFHWEIKDLITQFVAAFDDVVIKRYNINRTPESSLQVRYVYAPKQRVMYDIVNRAQNLTLPVISVSINSVTRSRDRVFNKIDGFFFNKSSTTQYNANSLHIRTPVPVDISVNMSIITKFQTDMDQIVSNFVPYTNPYIILSWKVPLDFELNNLYEIRSEVLWNDSIALSYPTDINASEKYRIVGDTSFTIKGWLFPANETPTGNIFIIDANLHSKSIFTTYAEMSGSTETYPVSTGLVSEVETVSLSGLLTGPVELDTESELELTTESGYTLQTTTPIVSSITSEIR